MKQMFRPTIIVLVGGFLFLGDQILKYLARVNPDFAYYIWKPWLGWELFLNKGIAFSLPFPNWLIILITPVLLLLLIAWAKEKQRSKMFYFGVSLIVAGAVSNFVDRVLWGATIDYLRVLTGVINLGDVGIVVGASLLLTYPHPAIYGFFGRWYN
ncbi:MAG: signal peptidase II [Patescibacteria group bacterium]